MRTVASASNVVRDCLCYNHAWTSGLSIWCRICRSVASENHQRRLSVIFPFVSFLSDWITSFLKFVGLQKFMKISFSFAWIQPNMMFWSVRNWHRLQLFLLRWNIDGLISHYAGKRHESNQVGWLESLQSSWIFALSFRFSVWLEFADLG
jgi:hypothetical protein